MVWGAVKVNGERPGLGAGMVYAIAVPRGGADEAVLEEPLNSIA